ncbi:putative 4-hydroxy-4-methyl-2-oxoglutarate aldolase 3 [Chenopodium quinoa]|uniref:putative 4-hydroxy-4-methyl-2-oxoglutarate aldolase 3 n=1 Tax=Chenopodium quinoa TaxID=63459 RepID=UPI000B77A4F7|nr:putative 4-hydroxy-4-methyl-2-oxoglutarate aldolase 3 [Chenopodium quinoa]
MVATTDICDANSSLLSTGELKVLLPLFKPYGRRRAFNGPVVTVKVFEDNVLVRASLESKAHQGKVLVVDGGGSIRCALLGGNLGQIAQDNGWAGIVVNGCVRDVDEIDACDIGVWALGTSPVKSHKKGVGEKHGSVHFAGAVINDGDWLWADTDGILISKHQLSTTS